MNGDYKVDSNTIYNNKIHVIEKEPVFLEYNNNTVVILAPEKPAWLKTSITGKWIYQLIQSNDLSVDEVVATAAKHYSLPEEAVKNSILNLLEQLQKGGFVKYSSNGKDNINNKSYPASFQNNLDYPNDDLPKFGLISVWLNLLSICNLSCKHCFLPKDNNGKPISVEKAKYILDCLKRLKLKRLYISGGEPLLHPKLEDILKYAKESFDWEIVLITNGFTDNEELIKSISKYLFYIQISIDGINPETHDSIRSEGSFNKAVNIFKILNSINSSVKSCISFTPHPENIHQIPLLYKFAVALNADSIYLTKPKIPADILYHNSDECAVFMSSDFRRKVYSYYDQLMKIYVQETRSRSSWGKAKIPVVDTQFDPAFNLLTTIKRACCGAAGSTLFINEKGDCYPCTALNKDEHKLGNLFETPIEDIYYKKAALEFRQSVHVDNIEDCGKCPFKYFCAGDCRALSPSVKDKSPYCEIIKERYSKFLQNISLPR